MFRTYSFNELNTLSANDDILAYFVAIKRGDTNIIINMLDSGLLPDKVYTLDKHYYINSDEKLNEFLYHSTGPTYYQFVPFLIAVEYNHVDIVKLFLKYPISSDHIMNAFMHVLMNGNINLINILLPYLPPLEFNIYLDWLTYNVGEKRYKVVLALLDYPYTPLDEMEIQNIKELINNGDYDTVDIIINNL